MQCVICHRPASTKLPFNCVACARDELYEPRIQHAQLLLERDSIGKQVEVAVKGNAGSSKKTSAGSAKGKGPHPAWRLQRAAADQTASEDRTKAIHTHTEKLRKEIAEMKEDISARRARLARRRSELLSAKEELSQPQVSAIEPLKTGIDQTLQRWKELHTKTSESRLYLCYEAAQLYRLKQHKRKKGTRDRDVYNIGDLPIFDLRDILNASPKTLTASTACVAHLTHLASHYLALKLPAELTLPHADYPHPTIFSPSSSYSTNRTLPFPGSTPSPSPSASRHHATFDHRPPPRPRVLALDKPLAVLAKEDLVAYASFTEGIAFLAWDIAWLCRTQGLPIGNTSWEDVCAIGKNLHDLLLLAVPNTRSQQRRPSLSSRTPSINSSLSPSERKQSQSSPKPKNTTTDRTPKRREKEAPLPTPPPPGYFSHGTSYAFLAAAQGTEYMRTWRLAQPVKVVEKVKAMLLAERTGAEWEILEGEEWADEGDGAADVGVAGAQTAGDGGDGKVKGAAIDETGVLVRPRPPSTAAAPKAVSKGDSEGVNAKKADEVAVGGTEKGYGWTKLMNRPPPPPSD